MFAGFPYAAAPFADVGEVSSGIQVELTGAFPGSA